MQYVENSIKSGKALCSSNSFNEPSHEGLRYSVGQESYDLPVTNKQSNLEAGNNEESAAIQGIDNDKEYKSTMITPLQKRPMNKINFGEPSYRPQFGRPFDEVTSTQRYDEDYRERTLGGNKMKGLDLPFEPSNGQEKGLSHKEKAPAKIFEDIMPNLSRNNEALKPQSSAIYNMFKAIRTWESKFGIALSPIDIEREREISQMSDRQENFDKVQKLKKEFQIKRIMSCAEILNNLLKTQPRGIIKKIVLSHGNEIDSKDNLILQVGLHIWLDYLHCWAELVVAEKQFTRAHESMPIYQIINSLLEIL